MKEPDWATSKAMAIERSLEGSPYTRDDIERIARALREVRDAHTPTQEAYDAACKALWHWRAEAERLGKMAGVKPREMRECE